MRSPLDDVVITAENRQAFDRIIGITKNENKQTLLFMHGPKGSGKTTVLRARGVERDLLSRRTVLFTHAPELISAIRLETSEKLLKDAGEVDVLLLDSFDAFFDDQEIGPDVCRYLIAERNRKGLDTIIGARNPLSAYDLSRLSNVFSDFEQVAVDQLNSEGRISLAIKVQERCRESRESAPTLSCEAMDYIANKFVDKVEEIRPAVQYLMTAAGFEDGSTISVEQAHAALCA